MVTWLMIGYPLLVLEGGCADLCIPIHGGAVVSMWA